MLTGQYRRIFHYHLKKCGGSTFNHWLDTLTFDERTHEFAGYKGYSIVDSRRDSTGTMQEMVIPSLAKAVFHWSDVVHSHGPLRMYAPDNTFCLTMLRDPVQRLISQFLDFRRLRSADTVKSPPDVQECVEDSHCLSLCDFLEKHGQRGGRRYLDNYMTRALVAGRIGNPIDDTTDRARCKVRTLSSVGLLDRISSNPARS